MVEAVSEELQEMFKVGTDKDINVLAEELIALRVELDKAKAAAEKLQEQYDMMAPAVSQQMLAKGIKNIKLKNGIMIIAVVKNNYYVLSDKKEDFLEKIVEVGEGGMIKKDIPFMTIQSFFKNLSEQVEDNSIPQEEKQDAITKFNELSKFVDLVKKNGISIKGLKKEK